MSRRSLRTAVIATAGAAALVVSAALAGSASADLLPLGQYFPADTVSLAVSLDNTPYCHEYVMTYTCGVDGEVAFTGIGKQVDNNGEVISGEMNEVARTYTFHATSNDTSNY